MDVEDARQIVGYMRAMRAAFVLMACLFIALCCWDIETSRLFLAATMAFMVPVMAGGVTFATWRIRSLP